MYYIYITLLIWLYSYDVPLILINTYNSKTILYHEWNLIILVYLQLVDVCILLGTYSFCSIRPCTKASKLYSSEVANAFTLYACKQTEFLI